MHLHIYGSSLVSYACYTDDLFSIFELDLPWTKSYLALILFTRCYKGFEPYADYWLRRQRNGREFHREVPASMSGRHGEDQVAHPTAGGARRAGLRGGSGFGRDDERNALLQPAAAVVLRVHASAGHDVPGAGRRESRVPRLLVLLRRAGEGLAGEGAEDEEGEGGRERRVREGEERGQDDAVGPRRAEASLLRRERSVPVRVGCGWRE